MYVVPGRMCFFNVYTHEKKNNINIITMNGEKEEAPGSRNRSRSRSSTEGVQIFIQKIKEKKQLTTTTIRATNDDMMKRQFEKLSA